MNVRGVIVTLALAGTGACASGAATHTASTTVPGVSSRDRTWLAAVHQANLAEVQVGEMAKKKGGSAAVRAAGAMLVTDHMASDDQVTRVASALKIKLPTSAAAADAATADRLADEAGAQFDNDFVSSMVTGHQKVITATQAEIAQGSVPQVKGLAQATLPILRKHLAVLRKAAATG